MPSLVVTANDATNGPRDLCRSPPLATLQGVNGVEYTRDDSDRVVDLEDDGLPVLPDQTRDDTDRGWGERSYSNDDRLIEDRPPHWS